MRNERVDFLRGLAIFLVLLLHFTLTYDLTKSPLASWIPPEWIRALLINGNYGVTIFFVVSGFLITSISAKRWPELRNVNILAFYGYRVARILPCLLLVLAVITGFSFADIEIFQNSGGSKLVPEKSFFITIMSVLTFWHNVLMQSWGYFNYCINVYWSLSVEEVFYLIFPLALVTFRNKFLIVILGLTLIVIAPIYRSQHIDNEIYYMYGYLACFDAIAMGCLTAIMARKITVTKSWGRFLRTISFIGLSFIYLRGISGQEIWGFSLIALMTATFLFGSVNGECLNWSFTAGSLTKPLRWLGRHSYELYLFHVVVLALMRTIIPKANLLPIYKLPWLALFLSLSALVAFIVSHYYAEPLNLFLRRKFFEVRRESLGGETLVNHA